MKIDTTITDLVLQNSTHCFWEDKISMHIILEEKICIVDFEMLLKIATGSYDKKEALLRFLFNAEADIEKKQNETNTTT